MPLVLSRRDLQTIFEDPVFTEEVFQLVQEVLIASDVDIGLVTTSSHSVADHAFGVELSSAANGAPFLGLSLRAEGAPLVGMAEFLLASDGTLLALASADVVDSWLSAVPAGLAARYLAPPAASTLGFYGTGRQAWAYLSVLIRALPSLSLVRIYGRDRFAARELAEVATRRTGLVVTVEDEPYLAVAADVVAVFGGEQPLEPGWLATDVLLICPVPQGFPRALDRARVVATTPLPAEELTPNHTSVTLADIVRGHVVARPRSTEPAVYQARAVPGMASVLFGHALRHAWLRNLGQRFLLD